MADNNTRTSYDMHDVLLALRDNVYRNLAVATLATVTSVDDSGTYLKCKVTPFPMTGDETRTAPNTEVINGIGKSVAAGDVVLVIYMDRDPRTSLTRAVSGTEIKTVTSESVSTAENLHQKSYGIIAMDLTNNWKTEEEQ